MFGNGAGSLADIAAVVGNNRNDENGWGGGAWWIWVLFFALFGWGGNGMFGWGGMGGMMGGSYPMEAVLQRSMDTQTILGKLDGITNGVCNLGYDQLNQMNGITNTVQQTGWNLQQTMNQNAIASMQQAWAAQQQASDCCCENRIGQMNIMNAMDKNNCSTIQAINQNGQNLMWANQQGFRDLGDKIDAGFQRMEYQAMARENADLRQQVNNANRDAALQSQANYIVNQVAPRSNPAYLTCNPNTGMVFPQAGLDQWQQYRCSNPCCPPQPQCCTNQGF